MVRQQHRLPREVVEAPSPEGFRKHGETALREVVSRGTDRSWLELVIEHLGNRCGWPRKHRQSAPVLPA